MPRSFSAILACVLLVTFLAIGFGAGPVHADTHTEYWFAAMSINTEDASNFFLHYVDANDDQKFSFGELVPGSFSGAGGRYLPFGEGTWVWYPVLRGVPAYHEWMSPLTAGEGLWWKFAFDEEGGWIEQGTGHYDYAQGIVPLPPSVFLLGAGLIGLAVARRKKRLGP